jgi:hypothetical protein
MATWTTRRSAAVATFIIVAAASIAVIRSFTDNGIGGKAADTVLKMQQLEQACKAYAANNDGNFPQSLQELVMPSATVPDAYIEGGPAAVMSSWGTPINYTIAQGPGGEMAPVFTAQSADGRRTATWPVWARR